jgi:His-Xaa-Ser system radical SAM maturase HxsB
MIRSPFRPLKDFAPPREYRLLPLRFDRLHGDRYIVTNDVGEYVVLDRRELDELVARRLEPESATYRALKARHFLFDEASDVALDLLTLKARSRAERIAEFTGLHIFVTTLRCDHSCQYCQVSRQSVDRDRYDMSEEHADKAVELVLRSPNPNIKIEFQGGEPLLNFAIIRRVVERARKINEVEKRDLRFVIASTLHHLTEEILSYCKDRDVDLSTSIDGPADLHDAQRRSPGGESYRRTVEGIERARRVLGNDRVSALMTTTPASLLRVEEIIDEFVKLGFQSIFLRALSPYGFAARSLVHRYDVAAWLDFYRRGLAHVLAVNAAGYPLREDYTTILLQKMFSPMAASYVDLQSPAGIGIGGIVYNYNGAVYASDEGRMLAEMGDDSFLLGHVDTSTYEDIITSDALLDPLSDTILECMPMCNDCAFLPYCGSDPVFHRATLGDPIGHKAFSAFCAKQMGMLRHLITLLETDSSARRILLGWV